MSTSPKMKTLLMASLALALAASAGPGMAQTNSSATSSASSGNENRSDAATHINKAAKLLAQMEKDQNLEAALSHAKAVFLVPDYGRAALGVGARGGAGVLLVRRNGKWADPAFYNMGGVSAGFQAGVEAGGIAFILNNQKALNSFKQDNKFSLNADAGLTLVNWSAKGQGNAGRGDITIWSDTEGLFGSAAVSVTDINFDQKETAAYYKRQVAARDVISGKVANPNSAMLRQALASTETGMGTTSSMGSSGKGSTSSSPSSNNRNASH